MLLCWPKTACMLRYTVRGNPNFFPCYIEMGLSH